MLYNKNFKCLIDNNFTNNDFFDISIFFSILKIIIILIIINFIRNYAKILRFNKYLKNQKTTTYIIGDLECSCNSYLNNFLKCKKCRLENVINLEDFTETIRFFKEIENKKRVNLILHLCRCFWIYS